MLHHTQASFQLLQESGGINADKRTQKLLLITIRALIKNLNYDYF